MYLCYLDESGTAEIPGNTSHYVLAGIAIPISKWRTCDQDIERIRKSYALEKQELHTAWILRAYPEQGLISNFEALTFFERTQAVQQWRAAELLRLQRAGNNRHFKQVKKNFRHTQPYVHLTRNQRRYLMRDVAYTVGQWGFARLFAECVDKINFTPLDVARTPDVEALEQVVSRFEHFLGGISHAQDVRSHGLLIHDNNQTVAHKHTQLMLKFHESGTLWTDLRHISETPLFVDSKLTSMVQIADLCSYSLRRYLENHEDELFDLIFSRADRVPDGRAVGVRHFSPRGCPCKICVAHGR